MVVLLAPAAKKWLLYVPQTVDRENYVPSKTLTKTDLDKKAVVLTEDLSRLLHQRGVFPSLGGGEHAVLAVKTKLKNTGEELLLTYYASLRNLDRPIEERCWAAEIAKVAEVGDEFLLEFERGRFTLEIRPPRRNPSV